MYMQRIIDTYVLIHAKATTSRHSFRFRVCASYLQGFGLHAIRPPASAGGGYCRQGLHAAIPPGEKIMEAPPLTEMKPARSAIEVTPRHPFDLMCIPRYTPTMSMLDFDGAGGGALTSRATMQH